MRWLAIPVFVLAGCSNTPAVEQSLAQCRLASYEPNAIAFQRDYTSAAAQPVGKNDAYSAFVIACMEAKGYEFGNSGDINSQQNKACRAELASGISRELPWRRGVLCFERL